MFTLFQILSIVLGTVMWTLLGQGLLYLLAGAKRETNVIYRFFALLTRPVLLATRFVTPRFIVGGHIGFVAFFLIVVLRIALYMLFYSQGWIPSIVEPPAGS